MTFPDLEHADAFIRLLLPGRDGTPLLRLSRDGQGALTVTGMWQDPLGVPLVVIMDNRVVHSTSPVLDVIAEHDSVRLTLQGDDLWRVQVDGARVALEGLFFTSGGMAIVSEWGFVCWPAEDTARLTEDPLAGLTVDVRGSPGSRPLH